MKSAAVVYAGAQAKRQSLPSEGGRAEREGSPFDIDNRGLDYRIERGVTARWEHVSTDMYSFEAESSGLSQWSGVTMRESP